MNSKSRSLYALLVFGFIGEKLYRFRDWLVTKLGGYSAKNYYDTLHHLDAEGHKFSDMQLCVKLVSFIYDKQPDQIRKDLWSTKLIKQAAEDLRLKS